MLKSALIANRGEIACRIIRTARATLHRHPELVSGSMVPLEPVGGNDAWMLKRVQDESIYLNCYD